MPERDELTHAAWSAVVAAVAEVCGSPPGVSHGEELGRLVAVDALIDELWRQRRLLMTSARVAGGNDG